MSEFRRRLMMAQTGGGALPYDAEVEYLESTGAQYIDTGILFSIGLYIDIVAVYTGSYNTTQVLVGPSADGGLWMGNVSRNGGSFGIGSQSSQVVGSSSNKTVLRLRYESNRTYLDGNEITAEVPRTKNPTTLTVNLFSAGSSFFSYAKIFECVMTSGDSLLRDYIPVRKNGIGYMYDKVSGELFGNAGTGNFIIGNDVN